MKKVLILIALALVSCQTTKTNPNILTKQEVREVATVKKTTQSRIDSTLKPKLQSVDNKVSGIQREVNDVENAVRDVERSALIAINRGIEANSEDAKALKAQTQLIRDESSMLRGQVSGLENSVRELTVTINALTSELVTAHEEIAKLNIRISKEYELRMEEIDQRHKVEEKLAKIRRQRNYLILGALIMTAVLGGLIYLTNKRGGIL